MDSFVLILVSAAAGLILLVGIGGFLWRRFTNRACQVRSEGPTGEAKTDNISNGATGETGVTGATGATRVPCDSKAKRINRRKDRKRAVMTGNSGESDNRQQGPVAEVGGTTSEQVEEEATEKTQGQGTTAATAKREEIAHNQSTTKSGTALEREEIADDQSTTESGDNQSTTKSGDNQSTTASGDNQSTTESGKQEEIADNKDQSTTEAGTVLEKMETGEKRENTLREVTCEQDQKGRVDQEVVRERDHYIKLIKSQLKQIPFVGVRNNILFDLERSQKISGILDAKNQLVKPDLAGRIQNVTSYALQMCENYTMDHKTHSSIKQRMEVNFCTIVYEWGHNINFETESDAVKRKRQIRAYRFTMKPDYAQMIVKIEAFKKDTWVEPTNNSNEELQYIDTQMNSMDPFLKEISIATNKNRIQLKYDAALIKMKEINQRLQELQRRHELISEQILTKYINTKLQDIENQTLKEECESTWESIQKTNPSGMADLDFVYTKLSSDLLSFTKSMSAYIDEIARLSALRRGRYDQALLKKPEADLRQKVQILEQEIKKEGNGKIAQKREKFGSKKKTN